MLKKTGILFFLLLFCAILPSGIFAGNRQQQKMIIFHSPGCHRCLEVKQEVMPLIENEFKEKVIFEYRDITHIENYNMALGLLKEKGEPLDFKIPLFYFGGRFFNVGRDARSELRIFILAGLTGEHPQAVPLKVDLEAFFKNFAPAAIIIAGLQDGINPCAFTVIVFFISFLAVQGYRRRELVLIGFSFILAVFLTYLCIGLGIFNFFYRLKGFWLLSRSLNVAIGIFSLVLGVFAVYDFLKFRKTGKTDELVLQLPRAVKDRIHKVIGFFYRRSRGQERAHPGLGKLILSAFITGFLVSLLESVCTGQVYLPTISFMLRTSAFKLQALGYLLLYNIMFVIPLIIIFILALLGVSSGQFSSFLKKHLGVIKLLMAVLFFCLGIFLVWLA